jgi:hypothetical protein
MGTGVFIVVAETNRWGKARIETEGFLSVLNGDWGIHCGS